MRTSSGILIAAALAALRLSGCVRDPATAARDIPLPSAKGVYVVNEGNFGRANASISYYDLESFRMYNDVFTAVNGKNLGDVASEMTIRGGKGYIVVDNSGKIEVIDIATNLNTATISTGAGSSPEKMVFVNDTIALVTDLYANAVRQVNVATGSVTGSIQVGPNPEGIAIAQGKAYVANSGFGSGNSVSVVSLAGLTVLRTVRVADNPNDVEVTPAGEVYVVCTGSYDFTNPDNDTPAKVVVIDPVSDVVVDSIFIGGHATNTAIGPDGIGYVPSTQQVVRVDTRVHAATGIFKSGTFYGVGVEAESGDVYLSDPKDYVQPGTVYIYASNGQLRTRFEAGVIPGSFSFKR